MDLIAEAESEKRSEGQKGKRGKERRRSHAVGEGRCDGEGV